ncbi:hypothetical protein Dimus_024993 [Dionaea muscipula]
MELVMEFSTNEIKAALRDIHEETPGQDGFISHFFRSSWDIVGHDDDDLTRVPSGLVTRACVKAMLRVMNVRRTGTCDEGSFSSGSVRFHVRVVQ